MLCKLHLRCLFAYARNRTPDVTRKFFQFRIIEFLTREISLEYDITLRRERFIALQKAEKQRVSMKFRQKEVKKVEEKKKEIENLPPAGGKKLGPGFFKLDLSNVPKKNPDPPQVKIGNLFEEPPILQPSAPPALSLSIKKPSIPALKIGGLTQDPEKKEIEKKEFVNQIAKEEDKSNVYELTRIQNSLDGTKKFQLALDKAVNNHKEEALDEQDICKENEFYEQQRKQREVYSDDDLQINILGLIFCLLLSPTRGTLEELYCSQYPINFGKPNVLFLLHHHMNHPMNTHILPRLQKLVGNIVPPLAGQRLLKLLSMAFFDSSMYKN